MSYNKNAYSVFDTFTVAGNVLNNSFFNCNNNYNKGIAMAN